jgi:TolB-like protein
VTSKRRHFAEGLADDLIKKYERREICRLEFVSKGSYRYKKE